MCRTQKLAKSNFLTDEEDVEFNVLHPTVVDRVGLHVHVGGVVIEDDD
jgi:hypothetical protein